MKTHLYLYISFLFSFNKSTVSMCRLCVNQRFCNLFQFSYSGCVSVSVQWVGKIDERRNTWTKAKILKKERAEEKKISSVITKNSFVQRKQPESNKTRRIFIEKLQKKELSSSLCSAFFHCPFEMLFIWSILY